jgi:hypothetical protein
LLSNLSNNSGSSEVLKNIKYEKRDTKLERDLFTELLDV